MIRKKRYLAAKMGLLALGLMLMFPGQAEAADKKTIYNSPYVSFSPDGKAFTTCAGDQNYTWYAEDDSTTVYTGIKSSLRSLNTGEHYYKVARWGEVPVGSWKVVHRPGQCIHDGYPTDKNWHGIQLGTQKCGHYYYSGWKAFCADCGESLEDANIYMSREAASSIQYLDLGSEENPVHYYYLCPFCRNLEQGVGLSAHWCKEISWNQYRVAYNANVSIYENVRGYMDYSYHMYNNTTAYEGQTVTPVTHLTANSYTRTGYVFTGWNTKPDGSGRTFADKAEIYNLSAADWNDRSTWTAEDDGTITLYAQWRRSESTLIIDANGGKYNGINEYSMTASYATKYNLQNELIDAPDGFTVSFETNGGSKTNAITGKTHFVEWIQMQPFLGRIKDEAYYFIAPDGNVDTIKASYQLDPVTLPSTTKDGWSFGGWYYDPDFTLPAGGAGDQITPVKDTTLYAQWVDLRLQSVDNYSVNGGKGAVDLSWQQADKNNKAYLVYQKREDGAWLRVNTANDISSTTSVNQTYIYDGQPHQYTVPYTGIYTLSAVGAQGQSYGSYTGGYGGSVSGTFWLRKGEILTCVVGGQNGYNGGGGASAFGNGGGLTSVVSNQKGTLLIAGGGGGAYSRGNGGAGGSSASVITGNNGQSGMAGGGAGYQGGTAGTYKQEVKELRLKYFKDVGLANTWQNITIHGSNAYGPEWSESAGGYLYGFNQGGNARYYQVDGKWQENVSADSYAIINGQRWWPLGGWNIATDTASNDVRVRLSETGIGQSWVGIDDPFCNGGTVFAQGEWTVVQAASNTPSYGGSNYINTTYAQMYNSKSGVRSGNGIITLQSKAVGYQDTLVLKGVSATDYSAPDKVSDDVTKEALEGKSIRVTWQVPSDNGTDYYHKVESYLTGSTSMLCESNVTKNTLVSGVMGYYYLVDQNGDTVVTGNANYVQDPHVNVVTAAYNQYLHIAAVDVAGNISETTHILIDAKDVLWKIYTKQLSIDESVDNVYPAADKIWYVRADGTTPFTLKNEAYMDGTASRGYQLNETIYETVAGDSSVARNIIRTASMEISDTSIRTDANGLFYSTDGSTVLQQYSYSYTVRSNKNRDLMGIQKFTISRDLSGQTIQVIPIAEADKESDKVYSAHELDEANKITLIADGEAPVIRGLEIMENRDLIDRRDGSITVTVTADDDLSGVKDFYVVIDNTDNAITKTYLPDTDGCIRITITENEPIFSGDFTVLGYAIDNVGNENNLIYGTTEFALESSVERILEPHEPVFKCGESGILTFTTWGYADRVEVIFPESMTALDSSLNKEYDYTDCPGYMLTEHLQFMVPLYTPENQNLEITVRAYKGDKKLEDHPTISVIGVSGTVLDEFRTRLR